MEAGNMFSENFIKKFIKLLVPILLRSTTNFTYGENYLYAKGLNIYKNKIIINTTIDDEFGLAINLATLEMLKTTDDILEFKDLIKLTLNEQKKYISDSLDFNNDMDNLKKILVQYIAIFNFKTTTIKRIFDTN